MSVTACRSVRLFHCRLTRLFRKGMKAASLHVKIFFEFDQTLSEMRSEAGMTMVLRLTLKPRKCGLKFGELLQHPR